MSIVRYTLYLYKLCTFKKDQISSFSFGLGANKSPNLPLNRLAKNIIDTNAVDNSTNNSCQNNDYIHDQHFIIRENLLLYLKFLSTEFENVSKTK